MQRYLLQPHVGTDEISKLVGRNLSQTFESCNLRVGSQVADSLQPFLVAVAVVGNKVGLFLFARHGSAFGIIFGNHLFVFNFGSTVAHAEQRCLQHINMSFLDQFGEELQEESDDEQSDVHTVYIGICCHYHLIISKRVESVFNVERRLQQVELFVFVDHLFGEPERVQWFSAEREHRLCVHIAAFGDGSAGRIALGDEDARLLFPFVLHVAVVNAAVAQFSVVQVSFLGPFSCQFGNPRHSFSFAFALFHLVFNHLGNILVNVQIVVYLLFHKVAHIFVDAFAVGSHLCRAQFNLRLAFEHRFLHVDGNCCHQSVSDVGILIFSEELLDGSGNMFLEGTLVSSALRGVLSVHKRVILFAILVGVCKGNLNVFSFHVYDGIEPVVGHVVVEQVFQSVSAQDAPSVIHDGQPRVQVGIVSQHCFHDVGMKLVAFEERVVWFEEDEGSVFVVRGLCVVREQLSAFENQVSHLAFSEALHLEVSAQCVHRLHTHSVQSHRLFKSL